MAKETEVILKSVLYNVKNAKNLEEAINSVEVLCDEETIAYVEKKIKEKENKK